MGRALLEVSPNFLVELLKERTPQVVRVANFGLPEDARVVDVRYIKSGHVIAIEVESAAYNEPADNQRLAVLPLPEFRWADADPEEQRVGDELL